MHVAQDVTISAAPDRVFDLYTDADRVPEWRPSIAEIADRSGSMQQVGTTFRTRYRGRSPDGHGKVIESVRPHRHVLAGAGAVDYEARLTLEPVAEGTRLHFDLLIRIPGGPLGRVLERVWLRRKVEREVSGEFARLSKLAATDAAALSGPQPEFSAG